MHRMLTLAATLALTVVTVAGCGSDDGGSDSTEPVTIEVTFADGDVTPKGERVEVEAGQPIEFVISSDVPGGLHIHSSPEQELEFEAGSSTHEVVIDKPGLVEVEAHDPAFTVVQLEVR